jgi:TonB family protein
MKKIAVTLGLLLLIMKCYPQGGREKIRHGWMPAVSSDQLSSVNTMSEIVPLIYPYLLQWSKTIDYASVVFRASCDGKEVVAMSSGNDLSQEQIKIINNIDLGTDLNVYFKFVNKDPENRNAGIGGKDQEMDLMLTVNPVITAQFPGGRQEMAKYIDKNIKDKFFEMSPMMKNPEATIVFTVDENGKIIDPVLLKSTTDPEMDKMIIEATLKMPKWKPAEMPVGKKVRQQVMVDFPFYGKSGC